MEYYARLLKSNGNRRSLQIDEINSVAWHLAISNRSDWPGVVTTTKAEMVNANLSRFSRFPQKSFLKGFIAGITAFQNVCTLSFPGWMKVKSNLSSCQATSYHFRFYTPFNFDSNTDVILPFDKYENQNHVLIFECKALILLFLGSILYECLICKMMLVLFR